MYALLPSENSTDEPFLTAAVSVDRPCTQRRARAFNGCYSCNH